MKIRTLTVSTIAALTLTACGFTPAHAPRTASGDMAFHDVSVKLMETGSLTNDEAGFYLSQKLRDRLGQSGAKHELSVTPKISRAGLGVGSDDIASRYDITMTAQYTLTDIKTGDVLDSGSVRSTSTFGAPRDPYGRDAAENNAIRQVSAETADRLLFKLAGYYASEKQ